MKRRRLSRAIHLVLLVALVYAAPSSFAQARVQVAPQIMEQLISPGGTLNEIITFTNAGGGPVQVRLELADFDVDVDGNPVVSPLGTVEASLAPYIRVTPLRARLAPGQSMRFRIVAELPEDFSHLRVMLYFVAMPLEIPTSPAQAVIVPKVGVPIYVESTASMPAQLELSDITVGRSESNPGRLELRLASTNQGDRIIRPPVTVEVRGGGGFYEVFEPNAGVAPVFPHRTRQWTFVVGPVPEEPLEVTLTFPTSRRDSFRGTYEVESAGNEAEPVPES